VISNRSKAYGITQAENGLIPTAYHNLISGKYYLLGEKDAAVIQSARERYDADLAEKVMADEPDLVVCAGWRDACICKDFLGSTGSKEDTGHQLTSHYPVSTMARTYKTSL
jgi:folate-dependent phosphoribosylglycinamide formyltransferase PurN